MQHHRKTIKRTIKPLKQTQTYERNIKHINKTVNNYNSSTYTKDTKHNTKHKLKTKH